MEGVCAEANRNAVLGGRSRAKTEACAGAKLINFEPTKTGPLVSLPETGSLPSARWFAECCFSGTRQRRLCRVFFFWHSAKKLFAECFFYTRQRKFQSTFWSNKLIQMKKFSTTKLYNSSRCIIFFLVFSSYDKVKVNLFTNLTYLYCSLWN